MELWFAIGIFAPIIWGVTAIIERRLMTHNFKSPYAFLLLANILALPFLLLIYILAGGQIQYHPLFTWIGIIEGAGICFASILLYKAVAKDDASRVVPISYLSIIFVLPLAVLLFREVLTPLKYLGIFAIAGGAMAVSYKCSSQKWKISPTLGLIIVYAIAAALNALAVKWCLTGMDYWSLMFWSWVGGCVLINPILAATRSLRSDFKSDVSGLDKKAWAIFIARLCLTFLAVWVWFVSMSLAKVSLASALPGLQPLFVLVFVVVLAKLAPGFIKEDIDKSSLVLKAIAVAAIIIGAVLLAV